MSEFTDDELLEYVLGIGQPDQTATVERRAKEDPEVAAQLSVVRAVAGFAMRTDPDSVHRRIWSRVVRYLPIRRTVIAVAVLIIGAGVAWAAWLLLRTPPLLEDNFNKNWFDSRKWHNPRPGVRQENGYLRLMNRGSIVTRDAFPGPIDVSFDWMWIDHAEFPLYSDDLCVVLRTSGIHKRTHSYEILDGVNVRFMSYDGRVVIATPPGTFFVETDRAALPMPAGVWHHIRITDDGETVSVFITGPEIDKKFEKEPAITVRCAGKYEHHKVAIYNRELVGEAVHESRIDNFELRRLK